MTYLTVTLGMRAKQFMDVVLIKWWMIKEHQRAEGNSRERALLAGVMESVTSTFSIFRSYNYKSSTVYNYD